MFVHICNPSSQKAGAWEEGGKFEISLCLNVTKSQNKTKNLEQNKTPNQTFEVSYYLHSGI